MAKNKKLIQGLIAQNKALKYELALALLAAGKPVKVMFETNLEGLEVIRTQESNYVQFDVTKPDQIERVVHDDIIVIEQKEVKKNE